MAVKSNTTKAANISATARAVDFVTRFQANWEGLLEILGVSRPIEKAPGTLLKAYTSSITLQSGTVAEGDEIPYSLATVSPVSITDITLQKYAKGVSIEAITQYGAELAIRKTDEAFLNELQENIISAWYTFAQTGSLTGTADTFQMGLAKAIGLVRNKFKAIRKTAGTVVAFVNIMDAYEYLGAANLVVQNRFGIYYIENFMGADRMILASDVPAGTIIATPAENIVVYYVNPSNAAYVEGGFQFTTVGETPMIGFAVQPNYSHAVSECYALMGMSMFAEYLDGIAVVTVGASS